MGMRVCAQCSLVVVPSHVSFIYLVMNMHYRKTQIYPSVLAFAEYQNTDTRQRCALPSARTRALGKHLSHGMPELCRVPALGNEWHSANCGGHDMT